MDKATNRSQNITITASSGLSDREVENMRKEAEVHAEEDKHRKEAVESKNHADNLIYQSEKTLRDNAGKIDPAKKAEAEDKIAKLREAMNQDDVENIQSKMKDLEQLIQQIGAAMYEQPGQEQAAGGDASQPDSGPSGEPKDDDVVDGEFKNV
jgi:molecular chaperone DnaK